MKYLSFMSRMKGNNWLLKSWFKREANFGVIHCRLASFKPLRNSLESNRSKKSSTFFSSNSDRLFSSLRIFEFKLDIKTSKVIERDSLRILKRLPIRTESLDSSCDRCVTLPMKNVICSSSNFSKFASNLLSFLN